MADTRTDRTSLKSDGFVWGWMSKGRTVVWAHVTRRHRSNRGACVMVTASDTATRPGSVGVAVYITDGGQAVRVFDVQTGRELK